MNISKSDIINSSPLLRENWIDISRAILIILVVLGHYSKTSHWQLTNISDYVFLFHMPAFFIISGYLYKPIEKIDGIKNFIVKKAKRLLIPYIAYLLLITSIRYIYIFTHDFTVKFIAKDLFKNIYGGSYLNFNSGILWFLSCLFFIEITWAIIDIKFHSNKIKLFIVILFYILAHIQAWYFPNFKAPFAIDIAFISLAYYYFGLYVKQNIFDKRIFISAIIFSATFLLLRLFNIIHYGLELAPHHYTNIILDFLIPVSLSVIIFNICYYIKLMSIKSLLILGNITLPIMCLHIILNTIFQHFFNYGIITFTIIGVIIPLILTTVIFEKNKLLSKLFLGK